MLMVSDRDESRRYCVRMHRLADLAKQLQASLKRAVLLHAKSVSGNPSTYSMTKNGVPSESVSASYSGRSMDD